MTVSLVNSTPTNYQHEVPEDTQLYCIDLPGETVECYVHKPKLKVLLRKHRDVIFDLKLGSAKQYKVYATQSDFYNARDKKLVEFERKQSVSFKDGERMHVWVSRQFKGELVLESGGRVMMRVDPKHWDGNRYDENPKTKPAPIIIGLNANAVPGQAAISPAEVKPLAMQSPILPSSASKSSSATEQQDMHVIQVDPHAKDTPQEIADFFMHGGEETAIDTNKILTRNWLANLIVGNLGYYNDNKHWINELWKEKFYLKKVVHKGGVARYYVIFKGHAGLRKYLTASKYAAWNPKILSITSGAGSLKGTAHAAWSGLKDTLKGGAKGSVLAIFFTITIDVAEWLKDYLEIDPKTGKSKKDLLDLFVKIGIDVAKVFVAMALGVAAVAAIIYILALSLTAGAAAILAIGSGVIIGFLLELADQKSGFSDRVNKQAHSTYDYLAQKIPQDYEEYSKVMKNTFEGVMK